MFTMNGVIRRCGFRNLSFLAMLLVSRLPLQANPIVVGGGSVFEFGTLFAISVAVLAEAACVFLLLRRSRTPRVFMLWLVGMHLLTYPLFLGLLWLSIGIRPELAVGIGEGMIVLIEGGLIYYLCRFAPSAKAALPLPSAGKALFASLIGNICSVAAFPLVTLLNALTAHVIGQSGME